MQPASRFPGSMLFAFICLVFFQPVYAEHEADHRYTVKGQVLDNQNNAVANADIKIMLEKKLLKQVKTDSSGNYKAKLHLHDPDYGKELEIITPQGSGKAKIEFTLGDKETERFHVINFIDGKVADAKEQGAGQGGSGKEQPVWLFIGIGVIVVLAAAIVFGGAGKKNKKGKKKNKKS